MLAMLVRAPDSALVLGPIGTGRGASGARASRLWLAASRAADRPHPHRRLRQRWRIADRLDDGAARRRRREARRHLRTHLGSRDLSGHPRRQHPRFLALADELAGNLTSQDVELVAGDSVEGFNPSHDVCRYITNAAVRLASARLRRTIACYGFPLEAAPGAPTAPEGALRIDLDDAALAAKLDAAHAYAELRADVARTLERFGAGAFRAETLLPIDLCDRYGWDPARTPFYETYGATRVAAAPTGRWSRFATTCCLWPTRCGMTVPPDAPLRILLTNRVLAHRTGTELYVRDVALSLLRRGHRPVVYSPLPGAVAAEIAPRPIPVVDDLALVAERPDIIHGHHGLETLTALLAFPRVPAVSVCHSWIGWPDAPVAFPRIKRYLAVDDTCRDRLIAEHAVAPERVEVVLNGVDLDRFRPRPPCRRGRRAR